MLDFGQEFVIETDDEASLNLFSFQTQEPKVDYKSSAIAADFLLLDNDDDDDHLMAGIGCLYQPKRTYIW